MKNIRAIVYVGLLFVMGFGSQINAQAVDFRELDRLFSSEPKIEVTLRGSLLKMAAAMADEEKDDVGPLLSKLQGIFVRGYELDGLGERVTSIMREYNNTLQSRGWETMARVREDGDQVYVLVAGGEDILEGMMVMVMNHEDNEVIFVNIQGVIDPSQISRLGRGLNIDAMEGIQIKN